MMQINQIEEIYGQLQMSILNPAEAPDEAKIIISNVIVIMKDIHLTLKDISEKISAAAAS